MNKIKEINLRPDKTAASYPQSKGRNPSHNGGPTMSADSNYSRTQMSKVNKNIDIEDEESDIEIDDYVKDVNDLAIIKEFVSPESFNKLLGVGKSGIMSIPIFGDLFAFGKFLFTIAKMRRASRKFTKKLSKLSMVDLGNDFLEPEGSISSERQLDSNLTEAMYRLRNLEEFNERQRNAGRPELKVTNVDIQNLNSKFDLLCKYVKDAIMEFIGFADIAVGQKGFFVNLGISMITFSELPDFITGEYATIVRGLKEKAQLKSQKEGNNKTFIDYMEDMAGGVISVPRKMLDFLGNVDLLMNPDKLARLSLVHGFLKHYDDIDTNEEKQAAGLEASAGTDYYYWLKDNAKPSEGSVLDTTSYDKLSTKDALPDLQLRQLRLESDAKQYALYLKEEHSLLELYEDYEEDMSEDEYEEEAISEFSGAAAAGGGPATPLGTGPSGKKETARERAKRQKAANIYKEHLQEIQAWKNMTSGRIK